MKLKLKLNQLERLKQVFNFKGYEEVVSATIENELGGYMDIKYLDKENCTMQLYRPYFGKHCFQDRRTLKFILYGE